MAADPAQAGRAPRLSAFLMTFPLLAFVQPVVKRPMQLPRWNVLVP